MITLYKIKYMYPRISSTGQLYQCLCNTTTCSASSNVAHTYTDYTFDFNTRTSNYSTIFLLQHMLQVFQQQSITDTESSHIDAWSVVIYYLKSQAQSLSQQELEDAFICYTELTQASQSPCNLLHSRLLLVQ